MVVCDFRKIKRKKLVLRGFIIMEIYICLFIFFNSVYMYVLKISKIRFEEVLLLFLVI